MSIQSTASHRGEHQVRPRVQERVGHPRERHCLDHHHVRHAPASPRSQSLSKSIFEPESKSNLQLLAINAHKVAPRTTYWLVCKSVSGTPARGTVLITTTSATPLQFNQSQFLKMCQLLAIHTHEMAPRTTSGLASKIHRLDHHHVRRPPAPRKALQTSLTVNFLDQSQFWRICQVFAIHAHKMAPRTT